MNCPKCGANLDEGANFCIKCGNSMTNTSVNNTLNTTVSNTNKKSINKDSIMGYGKYAIGVFTSPVKNYEENKEKFSDMKSSLIFSGVVALVMMLITLIRAMFLVVREKTFDYSTFSFKTTIDMSNLKDLNYLSLIGKNLLIYAGVIATVALIYYLASLLFKKNTNYFRLLFAVSTSIIPFVVCGMVVAPLLIYIWEPLYVTLTIASVIYSFLIFISLIDREITFENVDTKIQFHLICLTILIVGSLYIYTNSIKEETLSISDFLK